VYVPLQLPDRVVAFETYFSYRTVSAQTATLTGQIVPLAVGALVLLQLVQVPIAVSLARRVRRHEADRALLLEEVLSVSEREREEIAADLHDGVVQDLAGVGYALGAMSLAGPPDRREITDQLGTTVRAAVDKLRRLLVDIYPPDLDGPGLPVAIGDLAEPLRDAGISVQVDVSPLPAMSSDVTAILYRTAREILINVVKHAWAETVEVSLGPDSDPRWRGTDAILLRVTDDGVGPPDGGVDRRAEGHLGLPMLMHRIADLGGELTVAAGTDRGTVVEARLPVRLPEPPVGGRRRGGPRAHVGLAGKTLVLPAPRTPARSGSAAPDPDYVRD
jgi:signal transduction histidine kinase